MRCKICNGGIHTYSEVCQNCGSLSQSPVQNIKETVHNQMVNILLGSFGVIIIGIILFGATFD